MRLIDSDALMEELKTPVLIDNEKASRIWEGWHECTIAVKEAIDRTPTAEERKTGEWIRETMLHKDSEQEFYYYEERCSECGTKRKIGWAGVRYCPMCGARMVQEGE